MLVNNIHYRLFSLLWCRYAVPARTVTKALVVVVVAAVNLQVTVVVVVIAAVIAAVLVG